jgi:hypothetical protein
MPSLPEKRRRKISYASHKGHFERRNRSTGALVSSSDGLVDIDGIQFTVSEGHPFKHSFKGRDEGGPFFTTREYYGNLDDSTSQNVDIYSVQTLGSTSPNIDKYVGPLFPFSAGFLGTPSYMPPVIAGDDSALMTWGTTAIARCKPAQPIVDLSTSLAELYREGIPAIVGHTLWKPKVSKARNAPSNASAEYLNYVFGWSPLVSDIMDTTKAINQGDAILAQYERDAGKLVRRGYTFPVIETQSDPVRIGIADVQTVHGTHGGVISTGMSSKGSFTGTLYRTHKTSIQRWFSGAFTYWLPDDYYSRNKWRAAAAELQILYGVEITPEVLWNLAPWSWAADWLANYGDVLSNTSDFGSESLVMPYGYIMEKSISTYLFQLKNHSIPGVPDPLELSVNRETKRRLRASPFGFGLTWDGLTPKQLAILASIGISRS